MSMSLRDRWNFGLAKMRERKKAYQFALMHPAMQALLMDLAKFCRANESCFHPDARQHAVLEGRREVWLRIQNHLHLTPEQLMQLYAGQGFVVQEESE